MTREIKFRAWDKVARRIMTVDMLRIIGNCGYQQIGLVAEDLDYIRHPENVELMQYTGLKDKNGKEIYESDILNNGDIGSTNWIVTWNEKGFYSYCDDEVCEDSPMSHLEHLEIIGNIYENPNIIKANENKN